MDRTSFVRGLLSPSEAYGSAESQPARMNPAIARRSEIAARLMSPPTSVMDERYPAWKKSQDQAEQFLLAADFVSSAIPAAVMAAPYAKKGLLAAGKTLAPKVENYMARTGLLQPATVWHGSPHRFDKFDASKIGTGEGAQAYGHGLYFAEAPDVAKSYQSALSADRGFSYGGKTGLTRAQVQELVNAERGGFLDGVTRPSGVADSVMDDMVLGVQRKDGAIPRQYKPGSERAKVYEELRQQIKHSDAGALYKVDLPDEAIAKMLDWDKPLSQQTEVMRQLEKSGLLDEALKAGGFSRSDITSGLFEGRHMLPAKPNAGGVDASQKLRQAGIPGIRYLDGGSRGTGAGTSNYVVFPGNESLLKILSRE